MERQLEITAEDKTVGKYGRKFTIVGSAENIEKLKSKLDGKRDVEFRETDDQQTESVQIRVFNHRSFDLVKSTVTCTNAEGTKKITQYRNYDGRILVSTANPPPLNIPVLLGKKSVEFTGTGKTFMIDEDHPSYQGSHLLGHESELGFYAYYNHVDAPTAPEWKPGADPLIWVGPDQYGGSV